MSTRTNTTAQAAAARARAEVAARARAEAGRKAAEQAATTARLQAAAKKLASRDEFSSGRGSALTKRQLGVTGGALALRGATSADSAPRLSLNQLLTSQRAGSPIGGQRLGPPPTATSAAQALIGPPAPMTTGPVPASADQARADAAKVKSVYDSSKASGQNDAQASKAASAELERLAAQHKGDAAYVNALVREAGPTLDRIATTLGANTEGSFKSGADAQAIKDSIHSLAVVAEAGGAVTAATLGARLSSKVDNDSELNQFDDGFYAHEDNGGTNLLFDATVSAMRAQGKGEAAGELAERGGDGGFVDGVKDGVGSVVGAIGDAFGAVAGFATDLGKDVLHVVSGAGEFAVDIAKGTVDLIGDAASWGADQVGGAVNYAIEQGLKLAGPVLDRARELARGAIDTGLGITENINSLEPGDSVNLGANVHLQLGGRIDASADIQVKMDTGPDGKPVYTVSGEVEASLGIGVVGSGSVGVGGKMEFTFATPEEAARAAQVLASGAAGVAALSGPAAALAPALLPGPEDLSFLQSHLKSVEVEASVGAHFDTAAGVAEADVGASAGYRLNFENGKPTSVTRTTEVSADGSVGGPLELLTDSLGRNLNIPADAKAEGKVTIETTIPIDGSGVTDLAAFIANPATAAVAGPATTSITIEGTFTVGNDRGVTGSVTVDGIDASEARDVLNKLLNGDARNAFRGVEVNVKAEVSAFHDEGFEFGVDATVGGQGVSVNAKNEVRRQDHHSGVEVDLGQVAQRAPGAGGGGSARRI